MSGNSQAHAASPSIKSVANSGPVAKELEGTSFVNSRNGLGPPQGADLKESKSLPGADIESPEIHHRKLWIRLPMCMATSLLLSIICLALFWSLRRVTTVWPYRMTTGIDTEGIRTPAGRAQWISSPSP